MTTLHSVSERETTSSAHRPLVLPNFSPVPTLIPMHHLQDPSYVLGMEPEWSERTDAQELLLGMEPESSERMDVQKSIANIG